MVEYKLTYFNLRGRAELPRMIFAAAGQEFEDKAVHMKMEITEEKRVVSEFEEWVAFKPTTPFGQLPILDVKYENGKSYTIATAPAISRFLAKKFNLAGDGEIEVAQSDMYFDLLQDYSFINVAFIWEADLERKKVLKKMIIDEKLPGCIKHFESKLKDSDSGFIVGSSLTWVDLALYRLVESADDNFLNCKQMILDQYPSIKRWFEMIGNIPSISKWIKNRPDYLY